MKRFLILLMTVFVIFAMAGCGAPYEVGGLTTIETDTYSNAFLDINEGSESAVSVEPIVIIADDFELKSTGTGPLFFLEQSQDDGWHTMTPKAEVTANPNQITFKRGKTTLSYNWENVYGALPAGTYRVVGDFLTDEGETIYLSSEFEVTE